MIIFKEPKDVTFEQILDYKEEFVLNNEIIHGAANMTDLSIPEWVEFTENTKKKESLTPGFVTAHTFFALDNNKIVGIINARHELNDYLLNFGGHIGYSVRKSERRKGYAKAMLSYTVDFLFSLGLEKILITCDKNNIASKRTIESCGGILENEVATEDRTTLRYLIYKK
ncbi:GNAT family N-acetyltransferase [Gemella haemolysans]|uniref:GNAT family N-acetyltransferase n=1 Tax=Gemella haemolysans TaxID=1379 RepID=A0AAW6B5X5_9BACL|nr:GNAT family N-acetyltransferase [Gemella haemolysans]MDB6186274.1 GNAT family N-acetyltransferase [Gemella haemolysans]